MSKNYPCLVAIDPGLTVGYAVAEGSEVAEIGALPDPYMLRDILEEYQPDYVILEVYTGNIRTREAQKTLRVTGQIDALIKIACPTAKVFDRPGTHCNSHRRIAWEMLKPHERHLDPDDAAHIRDALAHILAHKAIRQFPETTCPDTIKICLPAEVFNDTR